MSRTPDGAMSYMTRYEADCSGNQIRRLAVASYPRRHAEGEMMAARSLEDGKWSSTVPDTIADRIVMALCTLDDARRSGRFQQSK
jgi:hypothetical protein